MKDSKEQLARDTLAFLKQEGLIPKQSKVSKKPSEKISLPRPKKIPKPAQAPIPSQAKLIKEPPLTKSTPLPIEAIRKHLPHLSIIDKIPTMQRVAILFEEEEELSFLTQIKHAIEDRFCPCSLLSLEHSEVQSFFCLLTPKDREHPKQILLAKASVYQDNISKKRVLWTQICQMLSPKSS